MGVGGWGLGGAHGPMAEGKTRAHCPHNPGGSINAGGDPSTEPTLGAVSGKAPMAHAGAGMYQPPTAIVTATDASSVAANEPLLHR